MEYQSKYTGEQIDKAVGRTYLEGEGAPTSATVGELGQFYTDTTTGKTYQCVAVENGTYTWVKFIKETDIKDLSIKGLTEEEQTKLDKINISGNGDKFLSDNGEYKELGATGSGLTDTEKEKLDKINISGNGDKFLSDNGEYKQLGKINGQSILDGDITINTETGETITVDSELNKESANPVQNKVIAKEFEELEGRVNTLENGSLTDEEKEKLNKIVIDGNAKDVLTGNGTYSRIGNINGMSLFNNDIDIPRIEVDAVLDSTSPNAVQNSAITGAINDAIKLAIENDSPSFDFIHNLTFKTNMDNPILEFSTQNKNAVRISALEDFVEYYNKEGNVVTGTYRVGEYGVAEEITGLSINNVDTVKYLRVYTPQNNLSGYKVVTNPRQVFIEFEQSDTNIMVDHSYPFDELGMYTCVFELDKYKESFTDRNNGTSTSVIKETNITETITKDNFIDIIKIYELYDTDNVNNTWYGRDFNGYVITPSGKVEYITASFATYGEDDLRLYFTYSQNSVGNFLFTQLYDVAEKEVNIPLADDITKIIGTDTTLTKEGVPADAKATGEKINSIVLKGETAPTSATVGELGQFYTDTTSGTSYQCKSIVDGVYTWVELVDKTQLDTKLDKVVKDKQTSFLYGFLGGSQLQTTFNIGSAPNKVGNGCMPQYFSADKATGDTAPSVDGGYLYTNTPTKPYWAANKKYVDDNKGTKLYKHTFNIAGEMGSNTTSNLINGYFYSTSNSVNMVEISDNNIIINEQNAETIISNVILNCGGYYAMSVLLEGGYIFDNNSGYTLTEISAVAAEV